MPAWTEVDLVPREPGWERGEARADHVHDQRTPVPATGSPTESTPPIPPVGLPTRTPLCCPYHIALARYARVHTQSPNPTTMSAGRPSRL